MTSWGKIRLFILSLILGGLLAVATEAFADNTVSSTITGTTTVDKAPPTASAPSIVINNQDVCSTATSVAVQTQILGFATGQTYVDKNCERLKLARSLYGMGMKVAAVSVLCQDERVFKGMEMAGTPCPFLGKIGKDAAEEWKNNEDKRPDYDERLNQKAIIEKRTNEKSEATDGSSHFIFGGLVALMLLLL